VLSANDFETFWLTATNVVLGLVTLVCILAIGFALYKDVRARVLARRSVALAHADDHAFVIPMLGVTMADGGERIAAPGQPAEGQKSNGGNTAKP
jgi:hypothetical protein